MKRPAHAFVPAAVAALLCLASGLAPAQGPDARARYAQEVERCRTHNTQDSLATCLREATNALDAARKGRLRDPGAQAETNATQRCAVFQRADDQAECVRRVHAAPVSGSVSGGGVLRESVTPIPAPQ